jgi:hypothetical protein
MGLLLTTFEWQVKSVRQKRSNAGIGFARGWTPARDGLTFQGHESTQPGRVPEPLALHFTSRMKNSNS